MKRFLRWILNTITLLSLAVGLTVAILWATTERRCDYFEVQQWAGWHRLLFYRGSFFWSHMPESGDQAARVIDLYVSSNWQKPVEWLARPGDVLGMRSGVLDEGTAGGQAWSEHAWSMPLGFVAGAAAILPIIVAARRWKSWGRIRWRDAGWGLCRLARRLPLWACVGVGLLWVHSLFWRGFEVDFINLPVDVDCIQPGAIRVRTVAGGRHTRYVPTSWDGWVLRVIANYSTRPRPDDYQPPRWQLLPGFRREATYDEGMFAGQPSRLTGYDWTLPYWFLMLVAGAVPLVQRIRYWRRQARSKRWRLGGHCPSCGYDLRATPDRCPECGCAANGTTLKGIP